MTIASPTYLATEMQNRVLFFSIFVVFLASSFAPAEPVSGRIYAFKMVDVDGGTLSTTDGHVTVLVIITRRDADKARIVGDRIPARCLGNPVSRMVTVIRFAPTRNSAARYILTGLVRRKLDAEAKRLKSRYVAKKLTADPRADVHAVADFDGQIASRFGLPAGSTQPRVLILARNGELLRGWVGVPTAEELNAAIP